MSDVVEQRSQFQQPRLRWFDIEGHPLHDLAISQVFEKKWSALADDFRTFLVQGNLEIEGLETTGLASA